MMDTRAAKLALARQKLKNHQEKKLCSTNNNESCQEQQTDSQHGVVAVAPDQYELDNKLHPESITDLSDQHEVDNKPHSEIITVQSSVSYHAETGGDQQPFREDNINVNEILISSKRNLELQVKELTSKLAQLESLYTYAIDNSNYSKQQISGLEYQLNIVKDNYLRASEEISVKEKNIQDLTHEKSIICDKNNDLQEQLEFSKSMLTAKESENTFLRNQVDSVQNQLDSMQLQLQQVTSGSQGNPESHSKSENSDLEILLQKNSLLEQQLKTMQKERDQINCHYEQYVRELNKQLKLTVNKNNELSLEVHKLSIRETNLIEQISDMEIRIQQMRQQQQPLESHQVFNQHLEDGYHTEMETLKQKYEDMKDRLQELNNKYAESQLKYAESEARAREFMHAKEIECEHDNISISKLTADIVSDKIAAQRAMEQNKKLKIDLEEMEKAFVKISRDKLELTEKVSAEKFLNRELTIKLAEAEEKIKDFNTKLRAKDEEMIRLQNVHRELEKKINVEVSLDLHHHNNSMNKERLCSINNIDENDSNIPKEDAMLKLQDRFLKIMDEVANLSDEKHRLEHIILQLQNETDTICEYVALYQHQRIMLKKRDEERSAQIKIFQAECDLLKRQLEELSSIILRLAHDTELALYFAAEPRHSELAQVMSLLTNLKSNKLIDSNKKNSELENFYPCSCCSGQLIEV